MTEKMIVRNLTEDEIYLIKNGIFYDYLRTGRFHNNSYNEFGKDIYINYPIKYIPDYIKETKTYENFLETINIDDTTTMLIPYHNIPLYLTSYNKNKIFSDRFIDYAINMFSYWDVDPTFVFNELSENNSLKNEFIIFLLYFTKRKENNMDYNMELYQLIPYYIDSKKLIYYLIKNIENFDNISKKMKYLIEQLLIINIDIINNISLEYINPSFKHIYDESNKIYNFLKISYIIFTSFNNDDIFYSEMLLILFPEYELLEDYTDDGEIWKLINIYNNILKNIDLSYSKNSKYENQFPPEIKYIKSTEELLKLENSIKNRKFSGISKDDNYVEIFYIIYNYYCSFLPRNISFHFFYLLEDEDFIISNMKAIKNTPKEKCEEYFFYIFEHFDNLSNDEIKELQKDWRNSDLIAYVSSFLMKIFIYYNPQLEQKLNSNLIWNKYLPVEYGTIQINNPISYIKFLYLNEDYELEKIMNGNF